MMILSEVSKKVCHDTDAIVQTRDPLVIKFRQLLARIEVPKKAGQLNIWISGEGTPNQHKAFRQLLKKAVHDANYPQNVAVKIIFKSESR